MDRIRGGFYGVAVGDALGATLEFMNQHQIKQKYGQLREIIGGGWLNLEPGAWTDDTEMTLAVAEGILADPYEPGPHIGDRFLEWLNTNPPDVGNTISAVYSKYLKIKHWHKAAREIHKEKRTAGNGALMRTLPVALMYKKPNDIYMMSMSIAKMTHWDNEAGLTCFLYCLLVREFINGISDKSRAWNNAKDKFLIITIPKHLDGAKKLVSKKLGGIENWPKMHLNPSGYTVDSLACAFWHFFHGENFEEAIVGAVNLGGDADTIGAITGGLAGVYWGYENIPERWLAKFSFEQVERLDKAVESFNTVKFVGMIR